MSSLTRSTWLSHSSASVLQTGYTAESYHYQLFSVFTDYIYLVVTQFCVMSLSVIPCLHWPDLPDCHTVLQTGCMGESCHYQLFSVFTDHIYLVVTQVCVISLSVIPCLHWPDLSDCHTVLQTGYTGELYHYQSLNVFTNHIYLIITQFCKLGT